MSKISSKISYYDLTGGLNNVSTPDTLNSSPRKTETPDIVNVEFLKLGGIKSMEGNTQVGDTQSAPVVGGWEYVKNNNKYMIIALQTGEVKRLDPVTETFETLFTFAHPSDRVSFCDMNNGVVATNGIDDLMFYEYGRHQALTGAVATTINSTSVVGTGTKFTSELKPGDTVEIGTSDTVYTIASITDNTHLTLSENAEETLSGASIYLSELSACNATLVNEEDPNVNTPIRGTAIQFYNGRLWVGGDNGLFYSQIGQYNKWDIKYDAGVIYSVYNDTSEIRALGLYADYMLVHKEFNTYLLTCTGDASTISVKPYSNVSCDSQQSWVVSNTKYYVYSAENMDIFPLTQRTVFSDKYLGEAITNKVRNVFQNLRDADLRNVFCVTLPKKRWMIFYMPMIDQVGSSYGLIYDFQCKAFIVRKVPQTVTIAFNYLNEVYIGTEDGKVLREFMGSTFDGEPIISYYKSPWFDWAGDYYQSFCEFAIDLAAEYKNDFYLRTFKDGDSPYEDRHIDDGMLTSYGLMWDGGEDEYDYNIYISSFPTVYYNYISGGDMFYSRTETIDAGDMMYILSNGDMVPVARVYTVEEDVGGVITTTYNINYEGVEYVLSRGNDSDDETIYGSTIRIPDPYDDTAADTYYTVDENVYFTLTKEGSDLIIKSRNPNTNEETTYMTLSNYYNYYRYDGHDDNNITQWDKDVWASGSFNSIRMLLPNNVFETFQLEIGTNELNQAFAIYGYNFRRIETEEAPW